MFSHKQPKSPNFSGPRGFATTRSSSALVVVAIAAALSCAGSSSSPDADVHALSGLPLCTTSLADAASEATLQPPAAGSDAYTQSSLQLPAQIDESLGEALAGEAANALNLASMAGYSLCRDGDVARWSPTPASGRAFVAVRAVGSRPLIVGAPHPQFEIGTRAEAVSMFEQLFAVGLVVAGTHRCASNTASGCDGTTGVCGTPSQPYPISDMAHIPSTVFDSAHRVLATLFPTAWTVSLHGMSGDGVSISNGTTDAALTESSVGVVGLALAATYTGVTSCNAVPGLTTEVRLCGTTNAQGRYLNGQPSSCDSAATSATGRFLHLEQSRSVRDQPAGVIAAFDNALPY